jgi:glycosyltransferase involved in cell wall biosynthesis
MTRILFYLPQLGLGGTEKTCLLFAAGLPSDIFECFLAFPGNCHHKERLEQFEDVLGKDHICPIVRTDTEESEYKTTIADVINLYDIDIVHSFRSGYREFPQPHCDFTGARFVETNVFGHVDTSLAIDRSLFMSEWLMHESRRRMSMLRVYIPEKRWDFVNSPVESPYTNDTLRSFFDIPDDCVVLGRCGRPDPGIYDDINVKAALFLMSEGYKVFMLAMAPPENMVNDLNRYNIPYGAVAPSVDPVVLSRFYNTVDIYTHARADGETFGVNIAEAMIHGKPVVTHVAIPSHAGMGVFQSQTTLVDNEVTGFVVPHDPFQYSQAVKKLIDDVELRHTMGRAGASKAYAEYHVNPVSIKLSRIYRELMNENSCSPAQ